MNELIKISEHEGRQAVSARELHSFLESKQEFQNWIKNRIKKYGFIENRDFEVFDNFIKNPNGGRPLSEYALTLNCAKELAMVEGNAKGKQARQYFINCEAKLKEVTKNLSPAEQLLHNAQLLVEQERKILEHDSRILQLEAKTTTRPNYFTIVGYATLKGVSCGLKLASSLGTKASRICKERNIITESIPDPRFGKVKTYPESVLNEVFDVNLAM